MKMIIKCVYMVLSVFVVCSTKIFGEQKDELCREIKNQENVRNDFAAKLRGPFRANTESRYIELLLVIDNGSYKKLHENVTETVEYCQKLINIVNELYSPLNIYVALVDVVIWKESDEINFTAYSDQVLTNFIHYRRVRLNAVHPNDVAYLITSKNVDGGVYDKVIVGTICSFEYAGAVIFDNIQFIDHIASRVAHVTGHALGMTG